MDFVPDTSVIIDGRFTGFISKHNGSHVILAEALIAEIEHQANEGRSIGSAAIQELKFLRDLHNKGKIFLDFYGKRPVNWQIERAKSGEIDELIRICAAENNATLVTGDVVQKEIAEIKGISVNKAYDMLIDAGFAEMNHKRVRVVGKTKRKNDEQIDPDWLEREGSIVAEAISHGYSKQKIMDSVESVIDSILGGDEH